MDNVEYSVLGPSWPWSYGSWIYNYLCNQSLSPWKLRVRTSGEVYSIRHHVIKFVSYWSWFSPGIPVSSTNKTDRHDIAEILLKVALNTINLKFSLL